MNTVKDDFRLSHQVWQKRYFDPFKKEDLTEYRHFLRNKRWTKNCPFILEWPFLTITDMIRTKLINTYIDDLVEKSK